MNTFFKRVIWLVFLAPLVYLALSWQKLPESVPMHFDLDGTPNRYGSKSELLITVLILSVVSAGMYFFLPNLYRIDPKKSASENKGRLQKLSLAIGIFLSGICCLIVYSAQQSQLHLKVGLVLAGVGLLFAIIGNYMHNVKPNYFFGMRLPWTLDDPENWKQTHALAGKLWFGGGILLAVVCLLLPDRAAGIVFFAITFILVTIPVIFSYQYFRKHRHETH